MFARQATLCSSLVISALLAAGLSASASAQEAPAVGAKAEEQPFKVHKIYFETNASACDMGIQVAFDSDGVQTATIRDPNGQVIHVVRAAGGLLGVGGQTEGFLESIEPVIPQLVHANKDCVPDRDEGSMSLSKIRQLFPEGRYEFEGTGPDGTKFDDEDELTYDIPDGPVLLSPRNRTGVNSRIPLTIRWKPVTRTIPGLLPNGQQNGVEIIAYQVLVYDANAGESPREFNVTVAGSQNSVTVPVQFLEPHTDYKIEVLAIEKSDNQTITEGAFSTQ
jgi:hypothetical protein